VQEEAKVWLMQLIRPFLLKVLSDGTNDYTQLLPKTGRQEGPQVP